MEEIGKNIRRLREQHGFTQAELGAKIGVNERYVSALERGIRNPGKKLLAKLGEALQVEERVLRYGEGEEKEKPQIDERLKLSWEVFERAFDASDEAGKNQLVSDIFAVAAKRKKD